MTFPFPFDLRGLHEHGEVQFDDALLQFHHVLICVLLGCAVVTAALGHWIDA